jgi:excisionase family DNA binding protein
MEVLALTIEEAVKAGGPRRAKLYQEIRSGRLRAVKVGRSTRILVTDLKQYLATLPAIQPATVPDNDAQPRQRHGKRRQSRLIHHSAGLSVDQAAIIEREGD